jgi:hypothetical protein
MRLADLACLRARLRIRKLFNELWSNADDPTYRVAQDVLKGKYAWLEEGAIQAIPDGGLKVRTGPQVPLEKPISGERVATKVGASG